MVTVSESSKAKKAYRTNAVTAAVIFDPIWMPKTTPDPRGDVATLRQQAEEAHRLDDESVREIERCGYRTYQLVEELNAEFGTTSPERQNTAAEKVAWRPHFCWFGAHETFAVTLGAPEPRWDGRNCCWWFDRDHHALDWVKSVSDVRRIPVPKWQDDPVVGRMMEARQRWAEAFPDSPPGRWAGGNLVLPGRRPAKIAGYAWFLDMGVTGLFDDVEFLTLLAAEPQLGEALMDKCFELSTSYSEFLQSLEGGTFDGLATFGGDCACLLSPPLYEKYCVAWDLRLLEHFRKLYATGDDTPCILHSCGPSAHLYPQWGCHPLKDNIVKVETRMLPEHVKELRRNVPDAFLELTVHPQHFDLTCVEPEQVKSTLRQAVEDAGHGNVGFIVLTYPLNSEHLARLEANLLALYEEMDEINRALE